MKKTIHISLSGVVFFVEEDAYEVLKNYLDSIQAYFSKYDDRDEIIRDIETRIAELIYDKAGNQTIAVNLQDVERVMSILGSVNDFDLQEHNGMGEQADSTQSRGDSSHAGYERSTTLYRDLSNKAVGGVCAGIANVLNIDPVWVRILCVALLLSVFYVPVVAALTLFLYVIAWMSLKGKLYEGQAIKRKKFYRDTFNGVLAGVASGLAAYFGVSVAVVRLLFVISLFFGGLGFIIYLAIWFTAPPARTTTERMEMMGEPVTLNNIEEFLSKNLRTGTPNERHAAVSLLLLPLRLLGKLADALSPVLRFIAEAARIFIALLIMFVAFLMVIVLVAIPAGVHQVFELAAGHKLFDYNFSAMLNEFSPTMLYASMLAMLIPLVALFTVGLSIGVRRWLLKGSYLYVLLSLWVIALSVSGYETVKFYAKFKESANVVLEHPISADSAQVWSLNAADNNVTFNYVKLQLKPHRESSWLLKQKIKAKGHDQEEAAQNARCVSYRFEQADSMLTFDNSFNLSEGCPFRAQQMELTLYVPVNRPFRMMPALRHILYNTLTPAGYSASDLGSQRLWKFDEQGKLRCLNCDVTLPDDTEDSFQDDEPEEAPQPAQPLSPPTP